MKSSIALALLAAPLAAQVDELAGVPYEKLETREATRDRMRDLLLPQALRFGDWYLLSPFPYAGHGTGDLDTPLPPEEELARMRAGGPGPDLERAWEDRVGGQAHWMPLGRIENRRVDLRVHDDASLNDNGVCYLWGTVEADADVTVELTMGSDDGLRLWLNGDVVLNRDVPRGLDPQADRLELDFRAGRNHLLAKVSQGAGGWDFQINSTRELDPRVAAGLQFLLDRDFPTTPERAYWKVATIPVPEDVVLEVGGLAFLDDGRPVVSTRRGDVYSVAGAYDLPPLDATFTHYASGLHEPLGLAVRRDADGEALYAVQRGELSRLVDTDGDDRAELYETFSDGWGVSGNYHEFAFGPKFDANGDAWVTLNVGFCGSLGKSLVPWRGWALRIDREGVVHPVCSGLRSPNGIGFNAEGVAFYVDNQGDFVATNRLSELEPGSWHGHPSSLRWRDDWEAGMDRPARKPASIWFPYRKMGQSAADVTLDDTGGAFGPFTGQLFVGDQTTAEVMRVALEQVDGHWQGACFPFCEKLDCGVNRVAFAPDGSMFVGQTDRGWGSVGAKRYGLQRIVWTGETPFEILEMRARPDGFELELTERPDEATALDPATWSLASYTYEYHADYGAPEDDRRSHTVTAVERTGPRTVRLVLDEMRANHVYELQANRLRDVGGRELLHADAYYTLIEIPAE